MNAPDASTLAERFLGAGFDTLSERERRVLVHVAGRKTLLGQVRAKPGDTRTFGGRLADQVASFGGSWTFISLFMGFLVAWALINTEILAARAFDPYPFIFLNLILSMIAAVQAPIILMSQNRQGEKDRLAAAHDYEVNLKAEIEILSLHEKLDNLRNDQVAALLVDQKRQLEMITELVKKLDER